MKKTALLLVFALVLTCLSGYGLSVAAGSLNPYAGFSATSFDETTNANCTTAGGMLGASGRNAVYTYKNIDFGNVPPVSVMLEIGGPANTTDKIVSLYIDKASGDPIATFNATTQGWSIAAPHSCDITQTITGVHTLYLKTASNGDNNFFNIRFTQLLTGDTTYSEYDESASAFTDVGESPYLREINIMHDLGFALKESGETQYYPHLPVTRGRFVQVIYKMMSGRAYGGGNAAFTDVEKTAPYYEAVCFAVDRGYVTGYGDGLFRPNKFIEISEAVTVLSRVLGYDVYAEKKGGFHAGYIQVASTYGLLDGIPSSGALTEEVMARLIYNAICADYFDIEAIKSQRLDYARKTDGILSQTLNIYRGEGLVSANNFTSLASPETKYNINAVYIAGEDYRSGESDARSLLGYECEFFYMEDDEEKTIISIAPLRRVETVEVSTKDAEIEAISDSEVVYYDADGNEETLDIEEGSYILYNGVAIDDKISSLVSKPFRGYIRYINNSNDKDALFIYEYVNVEIGGVSIGENLIYDNVTKSSLEFSDSDTLAFFTKKGNPCGIADLEAGDNAVLYRSKNKSGKTIYRFIVTSEVVTGTVEMLDNGEYYIDGSYYKTAPEFDEAISIGMHASFKLNSFGEIVGLTNEAVEDKVGYLLACGEKSETAFRKKILIKVLTEDNAVVDLELNETCTVDGIKYKDNTAALSSAMLNHPVGYTVNANNLVTKMDTIVSAKGDENDTLRQIVSADTAYYWGEAARVFSKVSGGLQEFVLNENGKVLCQWVDAVDAEDYTWEDTSELIGDPMTGIAYSFDDRDGFADIFLWKNVDKDYSDAFVINRIGTALNSKGETATKVYGYDGREEVGYVLSDSNPEMEAIFNKLTKGDWVRAYINSSNEITGVQILYLISGNESISYTVGGSTKTIAASLNQDTSSQGSIPTTRLTYGIVTDRNGKYVTVEHTSGDVEYIYLGSAVGIRYETDASGRVKLINGISADSIQIGDTVFFSIVRRNTASVYVVNQ